MAAYTHDVLDGAMLSATRGPLRTHALAALAVQSKWAVFDLLVSRSEHADDPNKDRLRAAEIEYFRAAVTGMPPHAFGRLSREQLAQDPPEGPNEENTYYLP